MCDYSLHDVASRDARVGDKLTTRLFSSYTLGFAAVGEPDVAVCLRPGTEIVFEREILIGLDLAMFPYGKTGHTTARFRQVNVNLPQTHHDALEFPDGRIVLVNALAGGQRATVLQLPAGAKAPTKTIKPAAQQRELDRVS